MTCIVCQANEVNPMIGKNFCSRICQELYLRPDLQWLNPESLRQIALAKLSEVKLREEFYKLNLEKPSQFISYAEFKKRYCE